MGFRVSTRSMRYTLHRLLGRTTTQLDGLQLACGPQYVSRSVAREIIKGGYERAERHLARQAIRPGDKVLEVGAGVGVVGLLCTSIAGAGNVTSYEANSTLEATIRRNFALNGFTSDLVLKAVTVDGAPITFYRNENVVSSSMFDRKLASEKIEVESVAINSAIAARQATVIVMDVEGAEVDILTAADLSHVREIIVEVHPHIVGEDAVLRMLEQVCAKGFERRARQHKTEWLSRRTGVTR